MPAASISLCSRDIRLYFIQQLYSNVLIIGNTKKAGSKAGENATVTKDELRDIRTKTEKGQKSDAIVLSQNEIERMKASTKIQTKEQEFQQRKLLEE